MYTHFGLPNGFNYFWDEFYTTKNNWEKRHLDIFPFVLLGTLVFPLEDRSINAHLYTVAMALFNKAKRDKVTIVPMILVEIYKALTEVKGVCNFRREQPSITIMNDGTLAHPFFA